jgi:hypothetical protein
MAQNLTTTAAAALLIWPIVALILYQTKPAVQATLWTILGAQLLLPVDAAFKLPGVPQFDKVAIGNIAALVGCLVFAKGKLRVFSKFGIVEALIFLFIFSPFVTSVLNGDVVDLNNGAIPSLGYYDGLSALVGQCLILIPYILGRSFFGREETTRQVLSTFVTAGLIYSIPILFEIRFSPQLHGWLYGYFPSEWYQEVKDGGFRPVVFMGHGITASVFTVATVIAATAIWRTQPRFGALPSGPVFGYLATVLVLSRSLGSTLYGLFLAPAVRFASPRIQIRIAVLLALFALGYPLLRTMDLVPTTWILDTAAIVSADRSLSLQTRFEQEQQLMFRALQRPAFGWGRWGRGRIYDANGRDISITDGRWVITLGQYGLLGFIAEFGLLAISVFRSSAALDRIQSMRGRIFLGATTLIVAISMIDLLPNSTLMPWTFLLAGALLSRSENEIAFSRGIGSKQRGLAHRPSIKATLGAPGRPTVPQPTVSGENIGLNIERVRWD